MNFTIANYKSALKKANLAPHQIRMLQANYHSPKRTITAKQMAKVMGYAAYNAANLHYGKLACRVGKILSSKAPPDPILHIIVDFNYSNEWLWILKPHVAKAIEELGWTNGEHTYLPEEIEESEPIFEGAKKKITINTYERSSAAREKCFCYYGCKCTVCRVQLSDIYGKIAQGFIHVHHLKQLAEVTSGYKVDPIKDLRPVCPTCHAIIHLRQPPFTISEIKKLIRNYKK